MIKDYIGGSRYECDLFGSEVLSWVWRFRSRGPIMSVTLLVWRSSHECEAFGAEVHSWVWPFWSRGLFMSVTLWVWRSTHECDTLTPEVHSWVWRVVKTASMSVTRFYQFIWINQGPTDGKDCPGWPGRKCRVSAESKYTSVTKINFEILIFSCYPILMSYRWGPGWPASFSRAKQIGLHFFFDRNR